MSNFRLSELLGRANLILDKGLHIIPGFVIIKSSHMESVLDRIDASIPEDVKEAELVLRRRDEIQIEAQHRADRIIQDAQNEANRVLSESELLKAVQSEADKVREQVINDCNDIKNKAMLDAENLRVQAHEEAMKIREGAQEYAEQMLNKLDDNLNQIHQIVRNGQVYLEKQRTENYKPSDSIDEIYKNSPDYTSEFIKEAQ